MNKIGDSREEHVMENEVHHCKYCGKEIELKVYSSYRKETSKAAAKRMFCGNDCYFAYRAERAMKRSEEAGT